jgi:hypothetical protein
MPNPLPRSVAFAAGPLVSTLLLCTLSSTAPQAIAQDTPPPPTALQRQFNRIDFAISGIGIITSSVSGIEKRDANVTFSSTAVNNSVIPTVTATTNGVSSTLLNISPSSTAGELFTLRYIAKPYVGFEYNIGNARFTQNYLFTTNTTAVTTYSNSAPPTTATTVTNPGILVGGAQATARELTLGYVAHPIKLPFGVNPYVGAGGGTMHFIPTPAGGQGLPFQYRAVYYYNLGVEDSFTGSASHLGVRLGFRQLIYLAPDFGQNYLTINRRAITSEPSFGFFLRF